ncbi:MAG: alpha/beta fold hydrolase [Promethearchaeota archaeon]|jgi:pimeloyl-ACP methyl ester carboxylesterase
MPYFDINGIKINYEIEGKGPNLVMIHGFASSIASNWRGTNWINVLKEDNRLILMDCRGHGKSDKPLDPSQYGPKMGDDIINLLRHLSIEKANFFGYSMGSRLTLNLLLQQPHLVNSAILGGFVMSIPNEEQRKAARARTMTTVAALKAENSETIKNPISKGFRQFAESMGGDLKALAAVMEGFYLSNSNPQNSPSGMEERLKNINVPVMTVVGSDDFIPGDKTLIAKLVPNACHFQIQGKDHLTVVPDPKFHMVVKAFLNYVNK